MIELKHIDKYYNIGTVNEVCLFKDFNLTVDDGDFISVIGSNGSGKTSMLNLICGSLEAEAGNIILNGEDISQQKSISDREDRTCLSKSSNGNLPIYDNP
mgnify:FL=1